MSLKSQKTCSITHGWVAGCSSTYIMVKINVYSGTTCQEEHVLMHITGDVMTWHGNVMIIESAKYWSGVEDNLGH